MNRGVLAGLLGCILALLGIFTVGVVFVPLAAICALVGLVRASNPLSGAGIGVSLLAIALSVVGFFTSPVLWVAIGLLMAPPDVDTERATTVAAKSDRDVSPTKQNERRFFEGDWGVNKAECEDDEGPNYRTFIDLRNDFNGKIAPYFSRYEYHCIIDKMATSGTAVTLNSTCYEFLDEYPKDDSDGHKDIFKITSKPNGHISINGKDFIKCKDIPTSAATPAR